MQTKIKTRLQDEVERIMIHSLIHLSTTKTSQLQIWGNHITVWTVVQTVLTATFNSYGDSQISTPHKINTPEPIDKKNRHNWLHPRGDLLYQIW